MLQKIRTKLGTKLVAWHALSLLTPVLLGVTTFGLALYAQPGTPPTHAKVYSQKTASKKATAYNAPPPSKKAVQTPPAAPPKSPPAAPAQAPVQAGTPKSELVVTPSPSSSVSGLTPTAPATAPAGSQAPGSQTTTGYQSTNWSGYLAANGSFTGISGSWTATRPTGNGSTTSADSTWIGIGGVTSGDLIQVGTQNTITAGGQVSTSAFYELLPNVSQPIAGVTVSPGDSMTASLSEISVGQWAISISDTTNGESFTINVSYTSSLSSAEWIEEDPSFSFRRQIPFDNFNGASFANGSTVDNGGTVNIAGSTAQPVTMVNNAGQNVAVPSAIGSDGASFTVTP